MPEPWPFFSPSLKEDMEALEAAAARIDINFARSLRCFRPFIMVATAGGCKLMGRKVPTEVFPLVVS